MLNSLTRCAGGLALLAFLSLNVALAQAPGIAPIFDPAQLPHVSGAVHAYTLVPGGLVDGLLLENGMQVLTAPPLSEQVTRAVKPGDQITAYGMKAKTAPVLLALAIVNEKSRQPVILGDIPLLLTLGGALPHHVEAQGGDAQPPLGAPVTLTGSVRLPIYGPQGGVVGALLQDGTIVRVPIKEAARVELLLKPGSRVFITGADSRGPLGRLVVAQKIGSSEQNLITLAAWDGPR